MVTTSDRELAESLQVLRNHGATVSEEQRHHGPQPFILPDFNVLGFNYRMTDIQGAVGLVQLRKMKGFIEGRDIGARYYHEQLSGLEWLHLPTETLAMLNGEEKEAGEPDFRPSWQAFVTTVDPERSPRSRNEIMAYLQESGVSTRPGTHAVHMLGYYSEEYGIGPDDFPNARYADDNSMAIPLHNKMSEADFETVARLLLELS